MRTHIEINVQTGEQTERPYTAEEEAAADAMIVAPSTDPADFPLTARQLRLGLIRHGISLATVQAAITAISDQQQRDEAQVYWEFSTVINWSHPMTQALIALVGITTEDAAAMWMAAKDYEA